ncbi:CoA transferase, partial [Chloroflexota bacterium]
MAAVFNKKRRHTGERIISSTLAGTIYLAQHGILPMSGVDFWGGQWATGPYDHAQTGYKAKNKQIIFGTMVKSVEQGKATFQELCRVLGTGELLEDEGIVEKGSRLRSMGKDTELMKHLLGPAFSSWDADELVSAIDKCGGFAASLLTYKELFEPIHEQVKANRMVVEQEHPRAGKITLVNNPWRFTAGTVEIKAPAPALGEHTEEILISLGYNQDRIRGLRDSGVI